jgi:arylsulfatase A-like enzyme
MKPNILFITIDSLRSDRIFGDDRSNKTPNIDKLISNGISFTNTISSSDSTGLSLGSVFTGAYPFKTNISLTSFNPDFPTYFEPLKNNGYYLTSTYPDLSFFKHLTNNFDHNDPYVYDKRNDWIQLDGGIGQKIIDNLKSLQSHSPWFYFIHLMDLHQPFYLPDKFNQNKFGLTRYDKMVSYIDEWVGKFIENIDFKNTLLVFTSDHGDYIPLTDDANFTYTSNKFFKKMNKIVPKKLSTKILSTLQDKKKTDFANSIKNDKKLSRSILNRGTDFLYDESLKIPLFFYGNNLKSHHSIPNLVRHVDIFSTILDIIGIKYSSDLVDGRSLLPLFNDEKISELPAYIENGSRKINKLGSLMGLRTYEYKFLCSRTNTSENQFLFDLNIDPNEEKNIAKENPTICRKMEQLLSNLQNESIPITKHELSINEEREIEKELKKLGYI